MQPPHDVKIIPVRSPADLAAVVTLFRAYAATLDVDLAYQDFEAELAAMPGKYAPPAGELLLARQSDGTPVGCVGLRPLDVAGCCEMKRLYVALEGRGTGLGRLLVETVIAEARRLGYRDMRLDTLPTMHEAQALYTRLGSASCRWRLITPAPSLGPSSCVTTSRNRPAWGHYGAGYRVLDPDLYFAATVIYVLQPRPCRF